MSDTDCRPGACLVTPDPVLPRCDVALPDGTYTNATVVVSGGCITGLSSGSTPLYTPDLCCEAVQGGVDGDDPCDCPPGEPGAAATVTVGQTHSTSPGTPPNVVNVGTTSDAIFEFYIPRGEQGAGSGGGGCGGVTDSTANIEFEGGCLARLPLTWPPALTFQASSPTPGVSLNVSNPDPAAGKVTVELDLTQFRESIENWVLTQVGGGSSDPNIRIVPGYICNIGVGGSSGAPQYASDAMLRFDPSLNRITSVGYPFTRFSVPEGTLPSNNIPEYGFSGTSGRLGQADSVYTRAVFEAITSAQVPCEAGPGGA